MNGILTGDLNLNLLLSAVEQHEPAKGALQIPTRENRKRKQFDSFEENEFRAIHAFYQLSGPSSLLEDRCRKEITIPFCYRINKLLINLDGFEQRFFSPKPPNNASREYKDLLKEGMWEYDMILSWLEEELTDTVAIIQDETPNIYSFVKENIGLIVNGMYELQNKYEQLQAELNEFMEEFQIKLKELKNNLDNVIIPSLEDDQEKVDDIIDELNGIFKDYRRGEKYFQIESKKIQGDLRTLQNQLIYLEDVKRIPFSATRQMPFPYLAEDRYFYLDPPSPDEEDPKKDYLAIQGFFSIYQRSVMWAHHNHFQGLLGRTIEMKNICREVFILLDELGIDLKKLVSCLPKIES